MLIVKPEEERKPTKERRRALSVFELYCLVKRIISINKLSLIKVFD
jgi:hypothetical protein